MLIKPTPHIFKLILSVGFLFAFNSVKAQFTEPENELLWEISGNGLKNKSYLYGSLHSNDKRLFRFSDSVYVALNRAEAIILETDIFSLFEDWDTRKEEIKVLYDNKGMPYTGSNKATKTLYGNEDGMPQFLDAYFLEYCYNAQKRFFPLERVEDQLNLVSDYVKPELEGIAETALDFTQERLTEIYLKGDISLLDRMMRTNMSIYPGMYDDLIVNRNKGMFRGIDSLIRQQPVFCAVGAGHLSGEQGLINLLRKKGYKLRKVQAVYSEKQIVEAKEVKSNRSYTYKLDSIGLAAIFPGKPLETSIWDNHPYIIYREMGQGNTYSIEVAPFDSTLTFDEQASIYIASPDASNYTHLFLDDGVEVFEGLSDTYTHGLHWVRLMRGTKHLIILRAYGGNKFMHSNRPNAFFSKVWID
jgi:uncharacterized protein YbaP (TraB family)